jgi:hypothetical protein
MLFYSLDIEIFTFTHDSKILYSNIKLFLQSPPLCGAERGMGGEFMVSMKQRFLEIYWKWLSKCSEKYFYNTQIQKSNPIN